MASPFRRTAGGEQPPRPDAQHSECACEITYQETLGAGGQVEGLGGQAVCIRVLVRPLGIFP